MSRNISLNGSQRLLQSFANISPANFVMGFIMVAVAINLIILRHDDSYLLTFLFRENVILMNGILLFLFLWAVKLFAYLLLFIYRKA